MTIVILIILSICITAYAAYKQNEIIRKQEKIISILYEEFDLVIETMLALQSKCCKKNIDNCCKNIKPTVNKVVKKKK